MNKFCILYFFYLRIAVNKAFLCTAQCAVQFILQNYKNFQVRKSTFNQSILLAIDYSLVAKTFSLSGLSNPFNKDTGR